MHSKRFPLTVLGLLVALALLWPKSPALTRANNEPTSVGLVSFIAETHANGVLLIWETATELNTAGFILHRRTGNNPTFTYLENIGFVNAVGGPALGFIYQEIDNTAVSGQTYTYRLIEVEYNSVEIILDEVTITVGGTATPTASSTPPISSTPTQTPIPSATVAATATASATPSPTNTPPSSTPVPSATSAAPSFLPTPTGPASLAVGTPFGASPALPTATNTTNNPIVPPPVLPSPTTALMVIGSGAEKPNPDPETAVPASEPTIPQPITNMPQNQPAAAIVFAQEGYDAPSGESYIPPQATPIPIGSDRPNQVENGSIIEASPMTESAAGQGRLLLWVGFLAALMLFIGSIIGSIILFTRNQVRA